MLPGFHSRLKQELLRVMRDPTTYERKRYGSLLGLHKWVLFVDRSENNPGAGRIFMNNIRGWIGGKFINVVAKAIMIITDTVFCYRITIRITKTLCRGACS